MYIERLASCKILFIAVRMKQKMVIKSEKRWEEKSCAGRHAAEHDARRACVVNVTVYLIYLNHVNKFIKYVIITQLPRRNYT